MRGVLCFCIFLSLFFGNAFSLKCWEGTQSYWKSEGPDTTDETRPVEAECTGSNPMCQVSIRGNFNFTFFPIIHVLSIDVHWWGSRGDPSLPRTFLSYPFPEAKSLLSKIGLAPSLKVRSVHIYGINVFRGGRIWGRRRPHPLDVELRGPRDGQSQLGGFRT